jgi:predicted PP-loop superfamily ATPase
MEATMKACRKCGAMKSLDDYYKHPMMADGRLHTCKECHKSDVKKNYADKREIKHAYDAERFQQPGRRQSALASQRTRRAKSPEKDKARAKTRRAILSGRLIKSPCEVCGRNDEMVEAHHHDYSRPLDVHWLCFACHRAEHGHVVTAEDWRIHRRRKTPAKSEPTP